MTHPQIIHLYLVLLEKYSAQQVKNFLTTETTTIHPCWVYLNTQITRKNDKQSKNQAVLTNIYQREEISMGKRRILTLMSIVIILALSSLACNLFTREQAQPEVVVEEVEVIEDPVEEEEPTWSPELIFNLPHEEKVASVAYSHDGTMFATGYFVQADLFDASDASLIRSIELKHSADVIAFTPDDLNLAIAISVGGVSTYDLASGEVLQTFHGGFDSFLSISPDGQRIATGNRDGIAWLWDINSGEALAEFDPAAHIEDYKEYLTSVAFSLDEQILAAGYWDGTIFLWQVENGDLINILEPTSQYSNAWDLEFSPEGQFLAAGGGSVDFSGVTTIWNVNEATIVHNLADVSRTGARNSPVAFSPDGSLLAAGAMDGIYLWSLPGFELVHTIPIEETADSDWVTDLAFSPDSQRLLAGFWNGYAQVWQVQEPVE